MSTPKVFISYSWDDDDHKNWVAKLAADLRSDGIYTILDQWYAVFGDQLTSFMEKEIRENDYVLIICTPNYRLKSDERKGGVGYEGDIMTAEVLNKGNHRKFIPVLARGTWEESAPTWLKGKIYVDLSTEEMSRKNYSDLTATLLGTRPVAPRLRKSSQPTIKNPSSDTSPNEPVKIVGVIVDEVTEPKLDGTPGSALYIVPFRLNRVPSSLWSKIFIHSWDQRLFSLMHRPGIASIRGAKIILNGTTIEEVKRYHRNTLVTCVDEANQKEKELLEHRRREQELRHQQMDKHRKEVKDALEDLSFD